MKNNFDLIRKWWFLILFFGGALVWLVRLESKVNAQEEAFDKITTKMGPKIEQILLNQVRMQKDIEFIKSKVDGF